MLLTNHSNLSDQYIEDILSKYQRKRKLEKEIHPNMQVDTIADVISDKLISKLQNSLKI